MDSDDYTSEEVKRKRDGSTPDEIFKRSRKLSRTPQKNKQDKEDKIDSLMDMMRELMKDTKDIKQDHKDFKQELISLRQENKDLREENRIITEKLKSMEGSIRRLEKDKIRNNIIISGLDLEKSQKIELKHGLEEFIENATGVKVNIKEATEIGTKICKAELDNSYEKDLVMKNKAKLNQLKSRIYINNEMTKEEREIQKIVKQKAEDERKKGKNTKIGYHKVLIDGIQWKWDRVQEKLLENPIQQNPPKN